VGGGGGKGWAGNPGWGWVFLMMLFRGGPEGGREEPRALTQIGGIGGPFFGVDCGHGPGGGWWGWGLGLRTGNLIEDSAG